jgi:hypothetical protein
VTPLDGVTPPASATQRPDNARRVLVLQHHPDEDPGADPVVGMLPRLLPGLQWHEDEVVEPPPGAVVLARNEHSAVQARRVPPRTWSVQFHVEVGPGTVPKWAAVPEYERTLVPTLGGARALEEAGRNHLTTMITATANLVAAFLETTFAISPTGASEATTIPTGPLT